MKGPEFLGPLTLLALYTSDFMMLRSWGNRTHRTHRTVLGDSSPIGVNWAGLHSLSGRGGGWRSEGWTKEQENALNW